MEKVAYKIITVLSVWPLSGGIDSCATSVIVYSMCRLVVEACKASNQEVLRDPRMVCAEDNYTPESPQEFSNRIFHICSMGSTNSSKETRSRAHQLSKAIGAHHTDLNIDLVANAMTSLLTAVTSFVPSS